MYRGNENVHGTHNALADEDDAVLRMQCVFLIYCMLPVSWNGSLTIYVRVIRPFVLRHQQEVDSAIEKAVDVTRSALKEGQ